MTHEEKQRTTLCEFVGGQYHGLRCTEEYVEQNLCSGDHGPDWSEDRKMGGCVPREELDLVPEVKGYTFMWDGNHIRYETWEVYNMMFN